MERIGEIIYELVKEGKASEMEAYTIFQAVKELARHPEPEAVIRVGTATIEMALKMIKEA